MQGATYYKTSVVEGDNNGTINNIFEKVDISHLEGMVDELHQKIQDKKTLKIIVLASNEDDFQDVDFDITDFPLEKYGKSPQDWQPYQNEAKYLITFRRI